MLQAWAQTGTSLTLSTIKRGTDLGMLVVSFYLIYPLHVQYNLGSG